jgi:oligopeptide transport system permease protein
MGKYLFFRILRGALSVVVVTAVVMVLIYGCLDRNLIFSKDNVFAHQKSNAKEVYKLRQWENYGYVDYVSYADFLLEKLDAGKLEKADYDRAVQLGDAPAKDNALTARYVKEFSQQYAAEGYTVTRLTGKLRAGTQKYHEGGEPRLYAHRDVPLIQRLWRYLCNLVEVDNIHNAQAVQGERGLRFTLRDPAYGGKTFAPAILGNGTTHRYLLYFDNRFPFVHQNVIRLNLGLSYSVSKGVDVSRTLTQSQGQRKPEQTTYPSGIQAVSADDLHTARYVAGSYAQGDALIKNHFVDDYTAVSLKRQGLSRLGYSFTIGILSVILAYSLAVPLGIWMARHRGRLADKLGGLYVVFIMAVPSLAYIFLFKALGEKVGLPTAFDVQHPRWLMYVLPVVSLGLPAAANLMKWLRRYMVDQMDAEYVRFARSNGLAEGKIFRTHVLRNAAIPILHGLPGSVLGALVGAIITERVYVVPGAGNLLTEAIAASDNGVIVGLTLFYAVLSVAAVILADLLIGTADPRISLKRR